MAPIPSFGNVLSLATFLLLASALAQKVTPLQSCLEKAKVPAIGPSSPNYANETTNWQLRIKSKPAVIAKPETREQVAATLACGRDGKAKMSAMAGGHSFAAFGMGNDGTLVINMAAFKKMDYDKGSELLTVESGVRVGPASKFLWDKAGRLFPHVRHGRPGVAGTFTGGGFGTTSRLWGSALDNLVGVEYMLANGTIVKADAKTNACLLWAAKGAGSSYGVLLSLTIKSYKPINEKAMNYTIELGVVDTPTLAKALLSAQEYVLSGAAPDEIALRCYLPSVEQKNKTMRWSGYYYGDPKSFTGAIAPLMKSLPKTAVLTSNTTDVWTQEVWANPGLDEPDGGTSAGKAFYIQALTTTTEHPLSLELFTSLLSNIGKAERKDLRPSGFLDLWGGKATEAIDPESSAFTTAKTLWLIRLDGNVAEKKDAFPADGEEYMKSLMVPFEKDLSAAKIPLKGFGTYRDTQLSEEEWSARLYGKNYVGLKLTKRDYDPEGFFTSNNQSIPVPKA